MATATMVYERDGHRYYRRWNKHQVAQHMLVVASFITLVATGLPLRSSMHPISRAIVGALGGADTAGVIHRVAAVVLMLGSAYHLLYLACQWRAGHRHTTMWPAKKDVHDILQMSKFFVGLTPDPPRFHKYGFIEKFEYWAMVWGTAAMVATGFILWFPSFFIRILTPLSFDVAKVVHGYEAVLAALAIAVWHFYHAHWKPCVFPMSKVWLTGLMDEHELITHHPLEYERILAEARRAAEEPPAETETDGRES